MRTEAGGKQIRSSQIFDRFDRYQIIEYLGSAAFSRAVPDSTSLLRVALHGFSMMFQFALIPFAFSKGSVFGLGHQQDGLHEDNQK